MVFQLLFSNSCKIEVINPQSLDETQGKYIKLVDVMASYFQGEEGAIKEKFGDDKATAIISRWRKDQAMTPEKVQAVFAAPHPFCTAAIVIVRDDIKGSTYLGYPPPPGKKRSVLAEVLYEDKNIVFLKTFWVLNFS